MANSSKTEFEYQPLSVYFRKLILWSTGSLLILFLVLGIVQRVFESGLRERMLVSHERGLDMAEQLINVELLRAVQDAHLLAELNDIQSFLRAPDNAEARVALENTLATFADSYGYYDQIRLISLDGMEMVRINYEDSTAHVVPVSELQDKSGRDYVTQGEQLANEEVYISPLELNVELGQVEIPYQPVIRIVERVAADIPNTSALLVLNYKANHY